MLILAVVFLGGHIQHCNGLRGNQNHNKNDAVFQIREVERVSETKYLKLFDMLIKGDGYLMDRLVTAFTYLVLLFKVF